MQIAAWRLMVSLGMFERPPIYSSVVVIVLIYWTLPVWRPGVGRGRAGGESSSPNRSRPRCLGRWVRQGAGRCQSSG